MLNPDFHDMLSALSAEGAEYLLVGAYALAVHGLPRATGDMDIWVRPTPDNASRVWKALLRFGAPSGDLTIQDLEAPGTVFQIGVAPCRIDILTRITAVQFEEAWATRFETTLLGLTVPVINKELLIRNKRATDRPKDIADALWLESQG